MAIEDLWYKNAVIYCLDVEKYLDANGDGVGDFEGLSRRLEYLAGLGVNCVWLQPFYNSPNKDNGYDVSDYYSVHEKHGSLGDFVEFMNHARALGVRVVVDLVVNHTSVEHPWFQSARQGPESPFHDWYVWADERPADHEEGVVFPGVQKTTWTYDKQAKKYYFHRFYEHQADLNTHNQAVREEIRKIMGFWLELGVSGFRLDAVPFLIERKGAGVEPVKDYELLHEMRDFLQWRCRDAILLAEANVPPDESLKYFGEEGDHLQMMLNFPVNQRLFYALATADLGPLRWALEQTAARPHAAQWVQFLRSHDELDLGRLTDEQRRAGLRGVRPGQEHAALRPRHPPPADADAGQRPPPAGAGVQPAVLAAGHADDAVRRRDRHRRRPVAAGARVRPHADAVDGREARRLLAGRGGRAAGHRRRRVRLPEGQRGGPAARPGLAAQLAGAGDPRPQGVPRDQLGAVRDPARGRRRRCWRCGTTGAARRC